MNIIKKLGYQNKLIFSQILLGIELAIMYNLPYGISTLSFTITSLVFLLTAVLSFRLLLKIKCPKCQDRILWNYLNGSKKFKMRKSPFNIEKCPNCGFDPVDKI